MRIFCIFALFSLILGKMEIKTSAIVLQTIKYGDSQLIVDFFTEKLGRLSFMVRVPKSSKGKMKRQLFQPLMVLNLEFDYRLKSNLQRLRDVSIQIPFSDIPFLHTNLAFPCSWQNCFHMLPVMSRLMVRSIFHTGQYRMVRPC